MPNTQDNAYIENWVNSNQTRLNEIKSTNPALYGAVNGVLNYLNNYLGNTKPIVFEEPKVVEIPEPTNSENWKASDFLKTKIIVNTPEQSKRFQKLIFDLGGYWEDPKEKIKETQYEGYNFLFVGANFNLGYANTLQYFKKDPYKEIFYDDIFPSFKIGDKVKIPTTRKGEIIGRQNRIDIIDKAFSENQDYLYVVGIGDGYVWLTNENSSDPNTRWSFYDIDKIELYEQPKPKLKIGDKVKLPTTKNGIKFDELGWNPASISRAVNKIQNYLYVTSIDQDNEVTLWTENENGGDIFNVEKDNLELYEEETTTKITPKDFEWEQVWGSGLTPDTLVERYKEYVKKKGKNALTQYNTEQLIESFGDLYVIVDTFSNQKNYDEAYNYYMSKQPTSSKERWNIWKFVPKPEFVPIFKNFKKITDDWGMDDTFMIKIQDRTLFNIMLEAILREDLLYNSLSIPDLILGKKTNSIVVTEEEQSDFDDLLDQLNNLDL